jgi:gas vesicle protein
MEHTLNGTINAAKNVVESARGGAEQAFDSARHGTEKAVSSTRSALGEAFHTVSQIVGTLRSLDSEDALGWIGLSRRRGPFASMAIFGAGVVVGAGAGVLLAPMSGVEMRTGILRRLQGLAGDAKGALDQVLSEAKDIEAKAEGLVSTAAGALKKAETKVSTDAERAKDAMNRTLDTAVGAVGNHHQS